ncbi:MAG: toll/interleukin-1 receptor domain-containing protein [Rhodothermales bacterium]
MLQAIPEHVELLNRGPEAWNGWRQNNQTQPDLRFTDLSGRDLSGYNLENVYLEGCNLTEARLVSQNLHQSQFQSAQLLRTDFTGSDLSYAEFSRAYLHGAKLASCNLNNADLEGAIFLFSDLRESHLDKARFGDTILFSSDLSGCKSLDSIIHYSPSSVDHGTLSLSGALPLAFLRGVGFPDNYIDYIPALFHNAIQFYSCFISHSTEDHEFARRLYADLQDQGVRCYYAPVDMKGGKKTHEQIDQGIKMHDKLVLILSPASITSKWVEREIRRARHQEEEDGKRRLFPISLVPYKMLKNWKLFDSDLVLDLAAEIREYYIPDFTEWKSHDKYHNEFQKLLRDLRPDEESI